MSIVERFDRLLRTDAAAPLAWTADALRTRGDLDALARTIQPRLQAAAPTGSRIGLLVADGFTLLASLLAIWRHRSAAILLDASGAPASEAEAATRLGAAILWNGREATPLAADAQRADGIAAIKLTSGSTGTARGVAVDDANLLADTLALERTMGIGAGDRILAAVPMSFSYGLGSIAVPALAGGRELVLPEPGSPLALFDAARAGRATVLPSVPAFLRTLPAGRWPLPASIRLVVSAGARLPEDTARRFREWSGRPIHAFYGASECGGITFDRTGTAAERGSVGTPVEGVDVQADANGRICVRSPAVARWVTPADDSVHDGCYATPDVGELRDGELFLLGRANELIDVGGHKVSPREVESAIASLAGVRDVVVVPWQTGNGRAGCAALVAGDVDELAIRQHCVARLPAGKVPRCIVVLAQLPRDARGKLPQAVVAAVLARADQRTDAP